VNVYEKLNLAREKFHQSEIKKSGHNKFAGYYYFELADFVVPALKIFKEVGLVSVTSFQKDDAWMRIFNVEKPEEFITITSPMSEAALKGCHPVQNLGAVETYIRRYLWVTALEIVEHDALDATTGNVEVAPKGETKKAKTVEDVAVTDEAPKKAVNTEEQRLFVDSMIDWGSSCEDLAELSKLWKVNQKTVDELKGNTGEYKRLVDAFAEIKKKFKTEE
jgi:hypothetical protein